MRIWFSGPRLFYGLVRPGVSFAMSELRKKPTVSNVARAHHSTASLPKLLDEPAPAPWHARAVKTKHVSYLKGAHQPPPELPTQAPVAAEPPPELGRGHSPAHFAAFFKALFWFLLHLAPWALALYGFLVLVGCVGGKAMAGTALQCDSLPSTASIEVFDKSQTAAVCVEMLRVLEGVTPADIAAFSKVAVLISANGYEEDRVQIVQEIVEIIRLRGQFNKRTRWYGTYDEIYRSWVAFHGIVSPKDIIVNLRAMGPEAAQEMSDEAFMTLIVTIKYLRQHGDD